MQRAIMRPARETLFTVVPREDKYKAKAFIDTFVYRGGDVVGAQIEGLLGRLATGLGALVVRDDTARPGRGGARRLARPRAAAAGRRAAAARRGARRKAAP